MGLRRAAAPAAIYSRVGHYLPMFLLTAFLTLQALRVHRSLKLEEARRLARENIKDIIACGFDPDMTFIFSDIDHMGAGGSEGSAFYCNCLRIMRCGAACARIAMFELRFVRTAT